MSLKNLMRNVSQRKVHFWCVCLHMVLKTEIPFLHVGLDISTLPLTQGNACINISNFENYFYLFAFVTSFTVNQQKKQTETPTVAIDAASPAWKLCNDRCKLEENWESRPKSSSFFERCQHTEIWKVKGIKNIKLIGIKWNEYCTFCYVLAFFVVYLYFPSFSLFSIMTTYSVV